MSALASQWLFDTFIYTGLLIGLVLVLRRTVARHFGPMIAYALWALPLLRFIMPPLVLPASMAPVAEAAPAAAQPLMVILSQPAASSALVAAANGPETGIALVHVVIPIWLIGALGFLIWRARDYVQMRRELLADARPVGESGTVRLVETPAVTSPIAFGIGDKVVALPPGFMALYDRNARDFAIAHELAHHRGFDLLANVLAQPVLALHWFNPLAWWGWRAMRKDQEAACDARVIAGCGKSERAAYAQVIAGFAAGYHHSLDDQSLAAPMACPMLGEKSIIHRLRSLSMTEVPTPRRRLGIAILVTSALAMPATASITYAQGEAAQAPQAPLAPIAPSHDLAPAPRLAPERIQPPETPQAPTIAPITTVDPDEDMVIGHTDAGAAGIPSVPLYDTRSNDGALSPKTRAKIKADMRVAVAAASADIDRAMARVDRAVSVAHQQSVAVHDEIEIEFEVDCSDGAMITETELGDGRKAMIICQNAINEQTIMGLRHVVNALRDNAHIPHEARQEAIAEILEAIEELQESRDVARGFIIQSERSAKAKRTAYGASISAMKISAGIRVRGISAQTPSALGDADECDDDKTKQQAARLTV